MEEVTKDRERHEETAQRLLALRATLLEGARRRAGVAADLGAEVGDEADRSVADERSDLLTQLGSREREQAREIDDALHRLKEGTYGWCRRCGGPIAEERLRALPLAALCVQCQEAEEREGLGGPPGPKM